MKKGAVSFGASETAWSNFEKFVEEKIADGEHKDICEVGGGANPSLRRSFVLEHDLNYVILDISDQELAKAPASYRKITADIADPELNVEPEYDLVFSRMLAEHVRDGHTFHRNVRKLLKVNGIAIHFFPTLYAPPFVINRLLPERLAEALLHLVQSGRASEGYHGKFPAYYSWCRGPSRGQIKRLENLGYEIEEYLGFFGHSAYYDKMKFLKRLHDGLCRWLVRHPVTHLTSFAWLVLRKR